MRGRTVRRVLPRCMSSAAAHDELFYLSCSEFSCSVCKTTAAAAALHLVFLQSSQDAFVRLSYCHHSLYTMVYVSIETLQIVVVRTGHACT